MERYRASIMLCGGTGCIASRSLKLKKALDEEIERRNLGNEINVVLTGCNGFCAQGPVMTVYPDDIFYEKVTVQDVPLLIEEHFIKGRPVQWLMYKEPLKKQTIPLMKEIPFFSNQVLRALRNKGLIDAEKIDEYIARDGYQAAARALTQMTAEQVIDEMKRSGLRGREGAGTWRVGQGTVHYFQKRRRLSSTFLKMSVERWNSRRYSNSLLNFVREMEQRKTRCLRLLFPMSCSVLLN